MLARARFFYDLVDQVLGNSFELFIVSRAHAKISVVFWFLLWQNFSWQNDHTAKLGRGFNFTEKFSPLA